MYTDQSLLSCTAHFWHVFSRPRLQVVNTSSQVMVIKTVLRACLLVGKMRSNSSHSPAPHHPHQARWKAPTIDANPAYKFRLPATKTQSCVWRCPARMNNNLRKSNQSQQWPYPRCLRATERCWPTCLLNTMPHKKTCHGKGLEPIALLRNEVWLIWADCHHRLGMC